MILNVPGDKYSLNISKTSFSFFDVSLRVEFNARSLQKLRVRLMSDSHEQPFNRQILNSPTFEVFDAHPLDFVLAQNFLHGHVPAADHNDFFAFKEKPVAGGAATDPVPAQALF